MKTVPAAINIFLVFTCVTSCGVPDIKPITDYRIVGGKEAKPHSWPWQVAILYHSKTVACGASILDHYWILTAAHCFLEALARNYSIPHYVRVGEHDIDTVDDDPFQKDFLITKFYVHPKYVLFMNDNDIALIKLQKPIKFNKHVQPICLPKMGHQVKSGTLCYVTGWGSMKNTTLTTLSESIKEYSENTKSRRRKPKSKGLNQVFVPILDTKTCRQFKYGNHEISDNMFCAGILERAKDACQGDSGGPLVCKGKNNIWIQYGTVSWGYGCGAPGYPGVYTKVANYVSWIKKIRKKY